MAKEKGQKRKYFLYKYRVVIMNEDTLEEKGALRLNRLNVFVFGTLFAVCMIVLTSVIIIYTPLKQYILGFSEVELKQQVVELTFKTDSLENKIAYGEKYFESIQKILRGDMLVDDFHKDSLMIDESRSVADIDLEPTEDELKLRQEVADEEKYSTFTIATSSQQNLIFFPPVAGKVSKPFSLNDRHFGVDILAEMGTPVKAVGDGTIIFAEWSAESGFVVLLKHNNNFISVYKHNNSLTKRQGDFVKAGEVIATLGNTGQMVTQPMLHFELWNKGYAVDPVHYLNF